MFNELGNNIMQIGSSKICKNNQKDRFPNLHNVIAQFIEHNFFLATAILLNICMSVVERLRRRQWHPTPVLLPGKSHGQRSLVGCSPWGRKESDMTERLQFHFSLSCIGEGNGNPLQCSCLDNPRDGGAWWAAVYGGRTESDMT